MLKEANNQLFVGANGRRSLYDVIYSDGDAPLPLLIFCHGFKGFKDWGHFPMVCRHLAKAGFFVVKFNFSHNGVGLENIDEFTQLEDFSRNDYLKELADLNAIIETLESNADYNRLIDFERMNLIGHSRGGSMAILYAAQNKSIQKVISWAAVADLEERLPESAELEEWKSSGVRTILNGRTGQEMPMDYNFVDVLRSNKQKLNVEKAAKKLGKRAFFIHGENDSSVPLEHGFALHIWNPDAKFESIANANHTFGGKHPFVENDLPAETKSILKMSLDFLRS